MGHTMKFFAGIALCTFALVDGQKLSLNGAEGLEVAVPAPRLKDVVSSGGVSKQIIGGTPANMTQFPWQAAISIATPSGNFFCGGSLINPSWILTAAHCATGGTLFTVRLGTLSPSSGQVVMQTNVSIIHSNYNDKTLNHDLALIKLPSAVTLNANINTIKLQPRNQACNPNLNRLRVSGWGRTSNTATSISPSLMWVDLMQITNLDCSYTYGTNTIQAFSMCATGYLKANHSTCQGDSGGPLILPSTPAVQVGVVSFVSGTGCDSGKPSGYVRISMYHDWLTKMTGLTF